MACPLCDGESASKSWIGSVPFGGLEYSYIKCNGCHSHYASRMPDSQALAKMYGPAYEERFADAPYEPEQRDEERVLAWLRKTPAGLFVDYGCGSGKLLAEAVKAGWEALGVEFDEKSAQNASTRLQIPVLSIASNDFDKIQADILHLGDVLEHLTSLNQQMPQILRLLKPGGLLLAQGPLEANLTFFSWIVRLQRIIRNKPPSSVPPYHVMLATAKGQKRLFERFDIQTIEFRMKETAWPAPSRLGRGEIANLRAFFLYLTSWISRLIAHILPFEWGNRYFYSGRWNGRL